MTSVHISGGVQLDPNSADGIAAGAEGGDAGEGCAPNDDFDDRTVVDDWNGPWRKTDIPFSWVGYGPAFSVSDGIGRIQSNFTGVDFDIYDPPWQIADITCPIPAEYLIRFRMNPSDPTDFDTSFYVWSKSSVEWGSVEFYSFDGGTTLTIDPIHVTGGTSVVYTPGSLTGWINQWLWCRLRVESDRSMVRVWKDGNVEPVTWNINQRPVPFSDGEISGFWLVIGPLDTGTDNLLEIDSIVGQIGGDGPGTEFTFLSGSVSAS